MDSQYSWKKTEDIEIDMTAFLCSLWAQRMRIAVCALAAAFILGGYAWCRDRGSLDADALSLEEDSEMSDAEEQSVAAAVQLESEIRDLEAYLDNSVLMQLDPYHKNKVIMLYHIDHAESQVLPAVTESYLNFILNGGAAEALAKNSSWRMDKSCLAELISAYQKTYSFPFQMTVSGPDAGGILTNALFYVEITGKNTSTAEKMASEMQTVLKDYSAQLKKTAGSHRLMLISSMKSMTADDGLQSRQHEKRSVLSSNKANLKTMTDAFNEQQMNCYKAAVGAKEGSEESGEAVTDEAVSDNDSFRSVVKYMFFGFAGGVFAYGCIFLCLYVLRDTVKSAEEMKALYTFPFYGGILPGRTASAKQKNDYECEKAQVLNRIRLTCKKQGVKKLCAVSDFKFGAKEKECLENIAEKLKSWEIDMSIVENAMADTDVWDCLAETGNVLLVCRTGTTTHRMIDHEMNFYLENDITVTGAVAFLQNR